MEMKPKMRLGLMIRLTMMMTMMMMVKMVMMMMMRTRRITRTIAGWRRRACDFHGSSMFLATGQEALVFDL